MNRVYFELILIAMVLLSGFILWKVLKKNRALKEEVKKKDQAIKSAIENSEKITAYFQRLEQVKKEGKKHEKEIRESDSVDDLRSAFDANNQRLRDLRGSD